MRAPARAGRWCVAAAAAWLLFLSLLAPVAAAADRRSKDPGVPAPRETVDKVLEILGRPEYEGSDQEEEGIMLLLANLLSDLVDWVKQLRRTNRMLYWTIVGWLGATLFVIVGHVAWTVWRGSASGRPSGGPRAAFLDPAIATRAGRDPDRMLERADREAAAGRPAEGVPWLYLALLFRLERAGRLEFDPARTGLEYADALAGRPSDRRLWTSFLDAHDPLVFGTRECPREVFDDLRRRAGAPLPAGAAVDVSHGDTHP
jgi:hypothetical protein